MKAKSQQKINVFEFISHTFLENKVLFAFSTGLSYARERECLYMSEHRSSKNYMYNFVNGN